MVWAKKMCSDQKKNDLLKKEIWPSLTPGELVIKLQSVINEFHQKIATIRNEHITDPQAIGLLIKDGLVGFHLDVDKIK